MILQPKRWQKADDPKYDPIRHRQWFARLLKRKHIIPMMDGCFVEWLDATGPNLNKTNEQHCLEWGVDPREFRDYANFRVGKCYPRNPTFQHILDGAYKLYWEHNASRPIQSWISDLSPLYGVKSRHVCEMWEVDPGFYPTNYGYPRN